MQDYIGKQAGGKNSLFRRDYVTILSEQFMCPSCGEEKPVKKSLLPVEAIEQHEGLRLHFFCLNCGRPYQVSIEDGKYKLGEIDVEE